MSLRNNYIYIFFILIKNKDIKIKIITYLFNHIIHNSLKKSKLITYITDCIIYYINCTLNIYKLIKFDKYNFIYFKKI